MKRRDEGWEEGMKGGKKGWNDGKKGWDSGEEEWGGWERNGVVGKRESITMLMEKEGKRR